MYNITVKLTFKEPMEDRPYRVSRIRRDLDLPTSNDTRFSRAHAAVIAPPIPILVDANTTLDLTGPKPQVIKKLGETEKRVNMHKLDIPHIDVRERRTFKDRLHSAADRMGAFACRGVERIRDSHRVVIGATLGIIALGTALAGAHISTTEASDGVIKSPVPAIEHVAGPHKYSQITPITTIPPEYTGPIVLTKEMNQALESTEFAQMVNHPEEFQIYYEQAQAQANTNSNLPK